MVSGSFSLPSRGPFHLPSQYYALSVTKEYLALRGGSPHLQSRFHVSRPTLDPALSTSLSLTGLSPSLAGFPKNRSARIVESITRSEPRDARIPVWALSISLAATLEIDVSFSSSGYLDVSVHRVPSAYLWIQHAVTEVFSAGFPHSDISGSMDICSSPKLFAAYHVFHRLLVPRHPPYALSCMTNST